MTLKRLLIYNPSNYSRTDFIEFNYNKTYEEIGSDIQILDQDNKSLNYQIDKIPHLNSFSYFLSFLAMDIPAGAEDYSQYKQIYHLKKGNPQLNNTAKNISLKFFKIDSKNTRIEALNYDKDVVDFEISNNHLTLRINLHANLEGNNQNGNWYGGAITSVRINDKESLSFDSLEWKGHNLEKRLQLDKVQIDSLLLEDKVIKIDKNINLFDKEYTIEYYNIGLIRCCIVMKSEPFVLQHPLCLGMKDIECSLYRYIYFYPDKPYIIEDIQLETTDNKNKFFIIPNYHCWIKLNAPFIQRYGHIPDWFVVSDYSPPSAGIGFATDSHTTQVTNGGNQFKWALGVPAIKPRTMFYFTSSQWNVQQPIEQLDMWSMKPFFQHIIGHYGWYEMIYKPLKCNIF